jgi:hypothetical protein
LRPPPFAQPNLADIKSDTAVQKHDARQEADAALDKAQGFCEQGAHQFLRDGDCGEEINGAKTAFEEVIRISEEELERLKKDAEAAAIREAEAAAAKKEQLNNAQQQRAQPEEPDEKLSQQPGINQHPALIHSVDMIEADDDEDGSDDDYEDPSLLPSPPFRLMART